MGNDIIDRINAHFRGTTMYEGRKPTLLEDAAAEIESLRAKLAESEGFEVAMRHTAKILPNAGISYLIAEWDANGPGADAALAAGEGGD